MANSPQQPQRPASDAPPAAGGGASDHGGPGTWQRVAGAALFFLAVVGCVFALWPSRFGVRAAGVSAPETVLALSASAAVGALYFFLSAQVRRSQEAARQLTEEVSHRTEEAISSLRREVESLEEAVTRQAQHRIAATEAAARDLAEQPTTDALFRLLAAAGRYGLAQEGLRVALKGLVYLTVDQGFLEAGHPGGDDTGTRVLILEIAEAAPERATQRTQSRQPTPGQLRDTFAGAHLPALGQDPVRTVVREHQSLTEAVMTLEERVRPLQLGWTAADFSQDVERAFRRLSNAVSRLAHALERTEEPLELGHIEMVLDDEHVLMQPPGSRLTVVALSQPARSVELNSQTGEVLDSRESEGGIGGDPFVARELRYLRRETEEADRLRDRKRASGVTRQNRPR